MRRKASSKQLYVRFCRAYARRLGDKPADGLYKFLAGLKFWREHRYWPHLRKPRTFSEKIFARMLFDRNPQWTFLSDKLLVRDFVARRIGPEYLVPILWSGDKPDEIPFDELPPKFVLKTNHGCGYNIIVEDSKNLDRAEAKRRLNDWLGRNFTFTSFIGMSWAYKNIRPAVLAEKFLEVEGRVPEDYKFFCYAGRAEFVQVSVDRMGDYSERLLTRDFIPLDFYNGVKVFKGKMHRPGNFDDMLRVADSLAQGFDFIRVDLYNVGGRIFFGELTCYPAGGLVRFVPKSYDFVFGEKWNLA